MVSLAGSGDDSDGTVENFSWMQTGGTPVALTGAETRSASFIAPEVESDESLMFQLTVTDDDGASATDTVTITVRDSPGVLVGEVSGHTVFEGGTAEFTVSLATQPSAKVTIPTHSSDVSQGVAEPAQLVFTAGDWDRDQTVVVEGTNPDAVIGEQDFVIRLGPTQSLDSSYDGLPIAAVDMNVFELPLRAIHASGNWGTNWEAVRDWEANVRSEPLVPLDHIAYLKSLHVNWVGLSVALHYDDSMDSTVERVYSSELDRDRWHIRTPTFADDVLRQFIREFREHGINVYLTLAFEAHEAETADRPVRRWQLGDPGHPETGVPFDDPDVFGRILPDYWPWRPNHPDHQRFVTEFWDTYTDQAVHFARVAEEEGVLLYSLGTEIDRLFRTRSGGHHWPNDFRQELESMVDSVRNVYSGLLTYDMHYRPLTSDFFGPGSDHLWEDLDLDLIGVSAWFPLTDSLPSTVTSLETLEASWEQIFRDYVVPLAERNPGRPIVFLERGATDNVQAPGSPSGGGRSWAFRLFEFSDADGNGLDDGRETQANMYGALLNTMDKYPGVVNGVFWWDNWVGAGCPPSYRGYRICGKLSEEVVRSAYESFR